MTGIQLRRLRALPSRVWLAACLWAAAAVVAGAGPAAAQEPSVLVARVQGPITPVVADYLSDAVGDAAKGGHQALLVELDTPGGLDTSMRQIVQEFLGAQTPVIVYVTPSGARAASAGALISFSAHLAAMAPGTTIGAATPVNAETGETAGDKVINDAAAFAESIARERGRDVDFAVATVREGRAVTAAQAHRVGAVDLISADRAALLTAVDGRTVTLAGGRSAALHTADARTVEVDPGWQRHLLAIIADPNLAFLLLSIGTLALIYELASPGMGLGGVAGAIMLILAFFALSVLPVNVAGLALLALACALFAAEVFTPGVGVFATGGAIALAMAGLFLFDDADVRVDLVVLLPTVLVVGGGALLAGRLAWRARSTRPRTGVHNLLDATAVVHGVRGRTGQVRLEGSWWNVHSPNSELREGQTVRIVDVQNLTLAVEAAETPEDGHA